MRAVKYLIIYKSEESVDSSFEGYEMICRYLLQKFLEGCEEFEGFDLSEGINGGASRKRLFNTSTED